MATYTNGGSLSRLNTDPLRNFKFLVSIYHSVAAPGGGIDSKPLLQLGFTAVDGLSASTNTIPYRQGGYNTTMQQIPGQTTFSPVTLQRGQLFGTRADWDWFRQTFSAVAGAGSALDNTPGGGFFRATVDIFLLAHPNTTAALANVPKQMGWRLYHAWPTGIQYGPMNAGDNSFMISTMTLTHEGFDVVVANASTEAEALTAAVGTNDFAG